MKVNPLFPNFKERYFGWRYLLFQVIFLPQLLGIGMGLAGIRSAAIVNFLYFCINFLTVLIVLRSFWWESLMAARGHIVRILLAALGGFAAYWVLTAWMGLLILHLEPSFSNVNDQGIVSMAREHYWLIALGTVVLVPVAEEALNRGAVFGSLRQKHPVAAYLVSMVVFSLIHIQGYLGVVSPRILLLCFLQYLPAGLILAGTYDLSGSIFAPIVIHSAINAIAVFTMR